MSAELPVSSAEDSNEFPYRAISRGAVTSVVFFALALPGLFPFFSALLVLAPIGAIAAVVGFRAIRRYPNEFSGQSLAKFGLMANLLLLGGGVGLHTYIYLTEVPDGYTRVGFWELQTPQGALEGPTSKALEIDGEDVFLKGYIHPSSGSGMLRQFILVPDLGTCCFGGQPKSSDMIEITLGGGLTTKAGLIKKKLAGSFRVNQGYNITDFDNKIFYRMKVDYIR